VPDVDLTEAQARFVAVLKVCPNSMESTTYLAARMKTSRVAVVAIGRALERKGLAASFRSDDSQWAALKWALRNNR